METSITNDDGDEGGTDPKLIPEWGAGADDQVVIAGLAVVTILALLVGWNAWRGGDDDTTAPPTPVVTEAPSDDEAATGDAETVGGNDTESATGAVGTDGDDQTTDTTDPSAGRATTSGKPVTSTASTTSTAPASPVIGNVQAAVDPLPGAITAGTAGTVAVLEGFVANDAERRAAERAAAAVDGVTEVDNNLVVLEPAVQSALSDAGVSGATAVGRGTEISVSGTIDTEDDRAPALAAAATVEGVTEVVDDRLVVSVTAELNQLPQVRFATNSAIILAAGFDDLDTAADLLTSAGDVRIEVQGYTDTVGDAAANLRLSEQRAQAVRTYLVDAGVDPDMLTAAGFGETNRFGPDLAANRLVRFQQVDG